MPLADLIDEAGLVPYLLDNRLLRPRDAVLGRLRITPTERRNRNFRVVLESGAGYLVKQAKTPEAVVSLAHEARLLEFLGRTQDRLTPHLPRLVQFDAARNILVLELVRAARSLHDATVQRRRMSVRDGATLGRMLALVHHREPPDAVRPAAVPSTLFLHRPAVGLLHDISRANLTLIEAAQSDDVLTAGLDRLAREWQPRTLMHGDAKWDNVVIGMRADSSRAMAVLADWELGGGGDRCWDVGTVLATMLATWVMSIPMARGAAGAKMMHASLFALPAMHPAVQSFWSAYADTGEVAPDDRPALLRRSVEFAAGRLIQAAYEYLQYAARPSANAISMVQLAANVFRDPEAAARVLMGLEIGPGSSGA